MKNERRALMLAAGFILAGACTHDFPDANSEQTFACNENSDCVSGYECRDGFCAREGSAGGDSTGGDGGGQQFTVTVTIVGSGGGTVISSPTGIDCPTACATAFDAQTDVTLTATPNGQSAFGSWSGACTATPCTITMDADKSVTAEFVSTQSDSVRNIVSGAGHLTGGNFELDAQVGEGATTTKMTGGTLTLDGGASMNPGQLQ